MAQRPNPIEIYEAVRAQLRPILTAGAAQPNSSTTCSEWNVQALVNHAISVQQFAQDVLGPGTPDPTKMGDVNHAFPSEGVEAALVSITDQVLATLKTMDFEAVVGTPFGDMPGGQFIMVPITDMIVHTWDIAKSTGQNTTLDAGLCELGYNVLTNVAAGGRENGAFGPEITVPGDASFQDKMLALSGRQP
ncbi:MAG: TIGR03086 family protein [SAR202 cluster bacterium]|nr:TIGR03086 family protein [SAR202 cluster bacterium]